MAEELTIRLFEPEDAAAVVDLYRAVYGEEYPYKGVYDAAQIVCQHENGDTYRMVACTPAGEVVGHVALYRSSPPNRNLYEVGQLMIRSDHRRSTAAFTLLPQALAEIPSRYGLEALWGEAVCNHLFTQQMTVREKFCETGIEVGLMPAAAGATAMQQKPTGERGSVVAAFRLCQDRPQTIFVPAVYEEQLRFLYDGTGCDHTWRLVDDTLPAAVTTDGSVQTFPGAGVARFAFPSIGGDFEQRLVCMECEASAAGAVVTQAFLRLTDPGSGFAVAILRRRGYFLGGLMLRWFGDDALLLQKVRLPIDFGAIQLYSKRARRIRDLICQDYGAVYPLTVGGVVKKMAALQPHKTAAIYPQRVHSQTYAELDSDGDTIARALLALGAGCGHAALWAPNVPDYLPVQLGCARIGLPLVLVNTNFRAAELDYVLRQSDSTILFLADGAARPGEFLEILQSVREGLPALSTVILLGDNAPEGIMAWPEFLALAENTAAADLAARSAEVGSDDTYAIQYTSGTTGMPKGAMLSHAAYVVMAHLYNDRKELGSNDVLCLPMPFFHVYGNVLCLAALVVGGTVVTLERFSGSALLQALDSCGVTSVSGTPTMYVAALDTLARQPFPLTTLRGGDMAGSFCPPELVRSVIDNMGAKGFGILYGSTEGMCCLMSAPGAPLDRRVGTVGNIMPGYESRIIDPATGQDVADGEQGELLFRGPAMMTGYYNNPEATAKTVDSAGWLHSGDLARSAGGGYYVITGRIKDMIIRGGENIYPAEIESFLMEHPKVRDAQVVGIPCLYYGEEVIAFVRLKEGETAGALELKRYCRSRMAIHKVPAMFYFVEAYPLTASGKVQKFKLQELAQAWKEQEANKT